MTTLHILELLVAAAIAVYVILDPPGEWPAGWPEYPDVDYIGADELHELLTTPGRVRSIEHALPAIAGEPGQTLEFPVIDGWDADSILGVLAQVEAL